MDNPFFAFLIVDMQLDFFDQQGELSEQRASLVEKINELSRMFRASNFPVIWICQEFKPDLSDAYLEVRRKGIKKTIAGTKGCELLPELDKVKDDFVVIKKRYSAFFQTNLDDILLRLKLLPTMVVAGINSHACVRMTVVDAYQRDIDIVLASECIGSYDSEHHDITMRYLDGKMARALGNDEIINLVSSNGL